MNAELVFRGNQNLSEIGLDPPVAVFLGVCQRVARNLSPEAHMIELGLLSTKTRLLGIPYDNFTAHEIVCHSLVPASSATAL
jgi:hypothetical protein